MTLLQHIVSCNRIKTKEQKKSDMTYIYIYIFVKMYHKATFIGICNDFGIYLSVYYSKILSLMKSTAML